MPSPRFASADTADASNALIPNAHHLSRARTRAQSVGVTLQLMSGVLCVAKLRSGSPCRSAATDGQFCAYHAALADHLGNDAVANGDHTKQRNQAA